MTLFPTAKMGLISLKFEGVWTELNTKLRLLQSIFSKILNLQNLNLNLQNRLQ